MYQLPFTLCVCFALLSSHLVGGDSLLRGYSTVAPHSQPHLLHPQPEMIRSDRYQSFPDVREDRSAPPFPSITSPVNRVSDIMVTAPARSVLPDFGRLPSSPNVIKLEPHDWDFIKKHDFMPSSGHVDMRVMDSLSFPSIPASEWAALLNMHNTLPVLADNSSGWFVGSDPCSGEWMGIECSCSNYTNITSPCNVVGLLFSGMSFSGSLPSSIGLFDALWSLTIQFTLMSGSLPTEIGHLANLQWLDLMYNDFSGSLPTELGSLVNVQYFSLDENAFSGTLPTELGSLVNAQYFHVSSNAFRGSLPSELGLLTSVQEFSISSNSFVGAFPTELCSSLISLWYLDINMNAFTGTLPSMLGPLTGIQYLDVSRNSFSGSLPSELGLFTNLQYFSAAFNVLSGSLPSELGLVVNIQYFVLIGNSLTGTLPSELGLLTNVVELTVSSNHFSGALPSILGSLFNLQTFRVETNFLNGSLPSELGILTNIQYFSVGDNSFSGTLPSELSNLIYVSYFNIRSNAFTGTLPAELSGMSNMRSLFFDSNSFSGALPSWLGSLWQAHYFNFSSNSFHGTIPSELGSLQSLFYFDVSLNSLSGTIPTELGFLTGLQSFSVVSNSLTGTLPSELGSLFDIKFLRVRFNYLSGTVPSALSLLTNMLMMFLDHNDFSPSEHSPWMNMPLLEQLSADQKVIESGGWDNLCSILRLNTLAVPDLNLPCLPLCVLALLGDTNTSRCLGDEDRAVCGFASNVLEALPSSLDSAPMVYESSHPIVDKDLSVSFVVDRAVSYVVEFAPRSSLNDMDFFVCILNGPCHFASLVNHINGYGGQVIVQQGWFLSYTEVWGYYFTVIAQVPTSGWTCGRDPLSVSSSAHQQHQSQELFAATQSDAESAMSVYADGLCPRTSSDVGWTGVTCTFGVVTSIILSSFNILGRIPSELFTLSSLKVLDVHANAFTGSLPLLLTPSLTTLDLSFNKLHGSIPESLEWPSSLSVLSLNNNQLTGSVPLSLASLTGATSLVLAGNSLTGVVPAALCVLGENNVVLDLSSNLLSCYESCWSSVDVRYRKFGNIGACAPTAQPTYYPTAAPTTVSPHLASIVTPVVGGTVLIVVMIALLLTRSHRAKTALLSELPVHRMLQTAEFIVSDVLSVAASNLETLGKHDYDGRTVLDLALLRRDEELLFGLIQLTLPVDRETKAEVPASIHGFFWISLIQLDDHAKVVERILDANMELCNELARSVDQFGRPALHIACPLCQRLIELSRYLCKRYEVDELPVHISATCRVHLAVDHGDGHRRVALKFMRNRDQFDREQSMRRSAQLSDEFVVGVLSGLSGDDDALFGAELTRRGYLSHPHMLVMPAADKNLSHIISTERVASENWTQIHFIVKMLCCAVESLHKCGVIHGDIKPPNIVRVDALYKLIDLDASSRIGRDFTGSKYSSAYIPPELLFDDVHTASLDPTRWSESKLVSKLIGVRSPPASTPLDGPDATRAECTGPDAVCIELKYQCVVSDGSHDIWSLGVVFYELFSGTKLFLSNFEDNVDEEELSNLLTFTDDFKESKLRRIGDLSARNLLSQMLTKDPAKRPGISQVLAHPFVSGQKAARMVGEEAEFDVFLSYRVASDSANVERVYNALTRAGLKVWWDKKCLEPGVSWEEGFCDGLVKSRVFIPLLSRGAINHPTWDGQSFARKTADSPCDNVLLEHALALELQYRGLVEKIYPLMLGDVVEDQTSAVKSYQHYFATGCHPRIQDEVVVKSVQKKLSDHLSRQCLGSAVLEAMSVKQVLDSITINQGKIVEGDVDAAWNDTVIDVQKMLNSKHVVSLV